MTTFKPQAAFPALRILARLKRCSNLRKVLGIVIDRSCNVVFMIGFVQKVSRIYVEECEGGITNYPIRCYRHRHEPFVADLLAFEDAAQKRGTCQPHSLHAIEDLRFRCDRT